jgi:hypothetical protein
MLILFDTDFDNKIELNFIPFQSLFKAKLVYKQFYFLRNPICIRAYRVLVKSIKTPRRFKP